MNIEIIILELAWLIAIVMLLIYVPKTKIREAFVIFLFKQALTWLIGLSVVQYGLIEYPVRLFNKANGTSFSFEYFIYPAICVVFNLHYPAGKSYLRQFMHYFNFCTVITAIELACEKYTEVLNYIHWTWYITWITLFITFYISRKFYVWFFCLDTTQPQEKSP